MGNSRFVLAINGILMILLGGAFWFYPEFFSKLMFPNILDNDSTMNLAIALLKNMGAGCRFRGVIMLTCQSSPKFVAQRLLFSSGLAFCISVHCSFIENKKSKELGSEDLKKSKVSDVWKWVGFCLYIIFPIAGRQAIGDLGQSFKRCNCAEQYALSVDNKQC